MLTAWIWRYFSISLLIVFSSLSELLILDDEKLSRDILELLILDHCPEIEIVSKCSNASDAREIMKSKEIDLVFLDIAMPNETGFDFLKSIQNRDFSVIFITAYNQFALNAIKECALDYILKPIDRKQYSLLL